MQHPNHLNVARLSRSSRSLRCYTIGILGIEPRRPPYQSGRLTITSYSSGAVRRIRTFNSPLIGRAFYLNYIGMCSARGSESLPPTLWAGMLQLHHTEVAILGIEPSARTASTCRSTIELNRQNYLYNIAEDKGFEPSTVIPQLLSKQLPQPVRISSLPSSGPLGLENALNPGIPNRKLLRVILRG